MKTEGLKPKHVVFVRHGESEGDVRRALGPSYPRSDKHPVDEEQTKLGHEQSQAAGAWIAKFILQSYDIDNFDAYLTSPLIRTQQSADSLGIATTWDNEPRIAERDRGNIQGMTKQKHRELFPESYQQMLQYPFHWTPPGGESLLKVSSRLTDLVQEINENFDNVLIMTHRDVMWAIHLSIDGLKLDEVEQINTDFIGNGHILHYSNVSPHDGMIDKDLRWKRSIDPCSQAKAVRDATKWIDLKNNKYNKKDRSYPDA